MTTGWMVCHAGAAAIQEALDMWGDDAIYCTDCKEFFEAPGCGCELTIKAKFLAEMLDEKLEKSA